MFFCVVFVVFTQCKFLTAAKIICIISFLPLSHNCASRTGFYPQPNREPKKSPKCISLLIFMLYFLVYEYIYPTFKADFCINKVYLPYHFFYHSPLTVTSNYTLCHSRNTFLSLKIYFLNIPFHLYFIHDDRKVTDLHSKWKNS